MKATLTLILATACLTFCRVPTSSAQDGVDGASASGAWNTVIIDSTSGSTLELPVSDINGPIEFDQFNGLFGSIDGISVSDGSDAISSVPEPSTLSLAALGTLILLWRIRRVSAHKSA